jgi:CRISPR-associated protein Csb3
MNELHLKGDVRSALTHLAAYGLAAIVEDATGAPCHVRALRDGAAVRLPLGVTELDAATTVRDHAARRLEGWPTRVRDGGTGVMSPRGHSPKDEREWRALQEDRNALLDAAYGPKPSWLDLFMMRALGEPAYWFERQDGRLDLDRGASRWEMKTRNRGEDFVANRLSILCQAVANRSPEAVLAGMIGEAPVDEAGKNAVDSRTPTGLAAPGPTDNALAWCALWGISVLPTTPNASPRPGRSGSGKPSVSTGMLTGLPRLNDNCRAYVFLPLFAQPTRLARVRVVLTSGALARRAAVLALEWVERVRSLDDRARELMRGLKRSTDVEWLERKGCDAVLLAYQHFSDNVNAPEPHVTIGTVHRLGA